MKIGEVAERTGLSIRTIRHYEEMEVVSPSGRSPGGFRLYSSADVDRLLLIRRMKPLEFTLEEIRDFLRATDVVAAPDGQSGDPGEVPDHSSAPADEEVTAALVMIDRVRDETATRLAKLRKRVAYAEEFIELLGDLES